MIAAAQTGTTSTRALRSDKERESISCQWARQRGTDWCFFMDGCCPHKLGRVTPNTGRMGGTGQASAGVCRSNADRQDLPIPSFPSSEEDRDNRERVSGGLEE